MVGWAGVENYMMKTSAGRVAPWIVVLVRVYELAGCASEACEPSGLVALLPSVAFVAVEAVALTGCGDPGQMLGFGD